MSDYDAIVKARADASDAQLSASVSNLPPGYLTGFEVTLDTDYHVTVGAGSTSVEGQQVTVNSSHVIVDEDFTGTRLGQYFYYIYLTTLGDYKVDRSTPEFSDQYLYYAHPLFNWRAVGKIWVDDDNDIKYATGKIVGTTASVIVAAYDTHETPDADYKCTGTSDEIVLHMAIAFLAGAYDGGEIRLSRGTFVCGTQLLLDESNISIGGDGFATEINCPFYGTTSVFEIHGASTLTNIYLHDFLLSGYNSAPSNAFNIRLNDVSDSTLENLYIRYGDGTTAIYAVVCDNITINSCSVSECFIGLTCAGFTTNFKVSNFVYDGTGQDGDIIGITTGAKYSTFSNIIIRNFTTTTGHAIGIENNSRYSTFNNIVIHDLTASNAACHAWGIFDEAGQYCTWNNVSIYNIDNPTTVAESKGIYAVVSDYATFSNINVTDCNGYGVYLHAAVDRISFFNLVAVSNGTNVYDDSPDATILMSEGNSYLQGGDVGIGTSSPDTLLHIKKDDATAVIRLERNQADISTDDIVGRIEVETQDVTDPGVCAKIEAISEDTIGGTGWRFSTGTASALAEAVRIDQYGNLGVGVTDPAELVEIENAQTSTCLQISNKATDGDPYLAFALSGTKKFSIGVDDGDGDKLKIGTTAIGTNTRLTIDASGLVAVGSQAPIKALHVGYGDNTAILIQGGTTVGDTSELLFKASGSDFTTGYIKAGIYFARTADNAVGDMHFALNAVADNSNVAVTDAKLTILSNGNVGIGTSTVDEKLHVEGSDGTTYIKVEDTSADSDAGIILDNDAKTWTLEVDGDNGDRFHILENGAYPFIIEASAPTGALFIQTATGDVGIGTIAPNEILTVEGVVSIHEQAGAPGNTAAYGKLWVKNTAPCELWFTSDTGVSTQLA